MAGYIVYSFAVSVDGYIANAQGEIGLPVPEEALHRHFNAVQERTALSLYGRRMYEMMSYWQNPPAESQQYEVFDGQVRCLRGRDLRGAQRFHAPPRTEL